MKKHHLLWVSIISLLVLSPPALAIDDGSKGMGAQEPLKGTHTKTLDGKGMDTADLGKTKDGMRDSGGKLDDAKDMKLPSHKADEMGKGGPPPGKGDPADKWGKGEQPSGKADFAEKTGIAGSPMGKGDYAEKLENGGRLPGKAEYSDKLKSAGQYSGKAGYTDKLGQSRQLPGKAGNGSKIGKTGYLPGKAGYPGK